MQYTLLCLSCNERYEENYDSQICKKCHGVLEVVYTYNSDLVSLQAKSFWDYKNFLPDCNEYRKYDVGVTRLLKSDDKNNLFLKLELQNPTKSFKDRGSVIEIAKAKEYGYKNVVCASTGNMAYSIAYYAKLYDIKTTVYISDNAVKDKIRNILETKNAQIIKVDGDFTNAQKLAEMHSIKKRTFLTGDYCYRKEGQKTVVYEIMEQLKNIRNIIVPIGNATLFSGMLKSLYEIKQSYPKIRVPKLIGVQASSCSPLYDAVKSGGTLRYKKPKTAADAIAVGFPTFGNQAIKYMKDIESTIITVTDTEMKNEQKSFYKSYGIIAELAGVASIAAYKKLKLDNEETVAVITGGNV